MPPDRPPGRAREGGPAVSLIGNRLRTTTSPPPGAEVVPMVSAGRNSSYRRPGCTCEPCDVCRKANEATRRKRQADTLPAARRRYYVWTGPELEIAAREDLTSKDVALKLGRTLYAVKTMRERLRRDPRNKRHYRRVQDETASAARRHGSVWTGPELEIASRADLSTEQVALMLGRTYAAVGHARRGIRIDPRKQFLAGQRGLLP